MNREPVTAPTAADWPPALVDLYTAERTQLVRAAYLICGSVTNAEDAVHDAVARVAARWSLVDNGRSYLYVAAINAARDASRRDQRARRLADPRDDVAADHAALGADSMALRAALARVPAKHRTAIVLRYFLDWDDHEIATHLGIRPATVRSWVHRGITRLRRELDP